jgi:hypothetical protein
MRRRIVARGRSGRESPQRRAPRPLLPDQTSKPGGHCGTTVGVDRCVPRRRKMRPSGEAHRVEVCTCALLADPSHTEVVNAVKCLDCEREYEVGVTNIGPADAMAACARCGAGVCGRHLNATRESVDTESGPSSGPLARRITCGVCYPAEFAAKADELAASELRATRR